MDKGAPKAGSPPFPSLREIFTAETTVYIHKWCFRGLGRFIGWEIILLEVKLFCDLHPNGRTWEEMNTQWKNFKERKEQIYFRVILVSKYSSYHKPQWNLCQFLHWCLNTPTADCTYKTRVNKWRMVSLSAVAFSDWKQPLGNSLLKTSPTPSNAAALTLIIREDTAGGSVLLSFRQRDTGDYQVKALLHPLYLIPYITICVHCCVSSLHVKLFPKTETKYFTHKWSSISQEKCLRLNIPRKTSRCLVSLSGIDWNCIHLKMWNAFSWEYVFLTVSENCGAMLYSCLERWFPLQSSKWKYLLCWKQMLLFAIHIFIFVFVSVTLLNNFSIDIRLSLYFEIVFIYV